MMLRIGVVGYGLRISTFVKSCLREVQPDIRISGIVDTNEEVALSRLAECDQRDTKFYKDLQEMVINCKLDAILIGTSCNMHTPYAIEASKYDIPIFLEKPVAVSMKQALELEEAFENAKCEVLVSFPLRVSPLCQETWKFIQNDSIGHPEHIDAVNYVPYGTVYWDIATYRNFAITQGLFLQKATHDFDYMAYLMKSKIVRVGAMWNRGRIFGGKRPSGLRCSKCEETACCLESPQNRKKNGSGWTTEDHECVFNVDCGSPEQGMNEDCSSAIVEFASGAHGVYSQIFFSRRDAAKRGAVISGYHGTLSFDWYKNEARLVRHHAPFSDVISADSNLAHFGGDQELARNFIAMVQGKERPKATIWEGIQSVYTCLAAKESAEKGNFIKVRQVGEMR